MTERDRLRICVFCGARDGDDPRFRAAAVAVGTGLAARGIGLVYGGGRSGLMGAVADAALAAGGEVIGVIPRGLLEREAAHRGLSELRIVEGMHARKATMASLSAGFLALPGGFGTLEELFETLTWALLGLHAKPCVILDVAGYYRPLLRFLDDAVERGFIGGTQRALLATTQDPEHAIVLAARLAG